MAYFDGIKVGDRVYDMRWGWGSLSEFGGGKFQLGVMFDQGVFNSFTMDGAYLSGAGQTLFWSKPEFTPPPRPKRKVKKKIERWINVYLYGVDGGRTYKTRDEAIADADDSESVFYTIKLTGEYEVEE